MGRLVILFLCIVWLNAFAVELKPDHPTSYVVKSGDTLWGISSKFLKNPWDWMKIWHGNPGLTNPNNIYPGDVLLLRLDDHGQPQIVIAKNIATNSTIKLSPKIREYSLEHAIMTIPLNAIKPFLSRTRLITEESYEAAPYIISLNNEGRIISGELETIYVRGLKGPNPLTYGVYHKTGAYIDPDTKKVLGYEAQYAAEVRLKEYGDPATFNVINSQRELLLSDRLYPAETILPPYFLPTPATKGLTGRIIGVEGGVNQIGQYNIVVLNVGTTQGIAPGYVFNIQKPGLTVIDKHGPEPMEVTLPSRKVGVLMVFKTYSTVSYALVMTSNESVRVGERIVSPEK